MGWYVDDSPAPVQADIATYYEGMNVREMIEATRRWLGVAATDVNRYSDADVVLALNAGQNRFAKLTSCLLMPTVIILTASRQNYRLPYNTLKVKAARYYSGNGATDYFELDIIENMKAMQRIDSSMRGTTGTPKYLFPTYRAGNALMVGLSPIPSVDGEVWVGTDYGVLASATNFAYSGNLTGLHKTGFANSSFLVDSLGRNLSTLGALVGYPVFNVTDGSSGIITAIGNQAATDDKVSATLSGGTDNDWDAGDSFQIPMGEYGVILDGDGTETYTFTSFLGTIGDITGNTGNLVLDIARKPLPMSASLDTFICEIPSEYQEAAVAYAVYWLGRGAFKGVTQDGKAKEGLAVFQGFVQEFNSMDELVEETESMIEDRSGEWLT